MESMCAAANTISFKPFTHGRHVWTAETCVSHDHDPQWLFPRALFRGLQFHKLGGYHSFAALLQVLIASFAKILSAVSAQAESEQTGGTKHGYPVVAGVSPAISQLRSQHGCLYSYFSSSFTSANALTANSKSSRECAAETCVRTRAVPIGTTG